MNENYSLLKDEDEMIVKSTDYINLGIGSQPHKRNIDEYLKYGYVAIDKPANPSSHEVVTWVKNIFNADKTGHAGTLDPKVTGVLGICLNRATRLTKSQQQKGKTYICCIEFEKSIIEEDLKKTVKFFVGHQFQRPPMMCAVKRDLRLRWIYKIDIIDISEKEAIFSVECEAGTYIRSLCTHIGLHIGNKADMKDLRRVRSGKILEEECVTLHDLKDAMYLYSKYNDDSVLRKVVHPLERLLIDLPRIMIKDTAVAAITHGSGLMSNGVMKYDRNIDIGKECVIITSKGEAVALGKCFVSADDLKKMESGKVANPSRVIMEKSLYPKCWGGPEFEIIDE